MAPESTEQQYPLYNTTFSLHRVSPLYTGTNEPLNNTTLREHARRFRDILAGEVLRGVRVGLVPDDDFLARAGALQTVTWELLPEEEAWSINETRLDDDDDTVVLTASRGILVTINYENITYKAILLREDQDFDGDTTMGSVQDKKGFQYYPLMLSKMSGALRETFSEYLSNTFDTRISSLLLPKQYLSTTFEQYLSDLCIGEDGDPLDVVEKSKVLRYVIKDLTFVIGFDIPSGSLKTIDVAIAREDLPRMLARGKKIGQRAEDDSPFLDALAAYLKGHMALDMRHESVKVVRIVNAAFLLGAEGKIKLFQPASSDDGTSPQSRATRRLVNSLVSSAATGFLSTKSGPT